MRSVRGCTSACNVRIPGIDAERVGRFLAIGAEGAENQLALGEIVFAEAVWVVRFENDLAVPSNLIGGDVEILSGDSFATVGDPFDDLPGVGRVVPAMHSGIGTIASGDVEFPRDLKGVKARGGALDAG